MFVCLNLDFLTETNNCISTENVSVFIAHNLENVSSNGALICLAGVKTVRFLDIDLFDAEICSKVSISLLVTEDDRVTRVEAAIS